MIRLTIRLGRHRLVKPIRADNFRAAPLHELQVDVLRALVETLPAKEAF